MAALTETEARARAWLLDVESYDVFLDLTTEPVRSRSEIRFRGRQPGAATFADLTAEMTSAVLNGAELEPPAGVRITVRAWGGAVPAWLDRIGLAEPTMVSTHTVSAPSLASWASPPEGDLVRHRYRSR